MTVQNAFTQFKQGFGFGLGFNLGQRFFGAFTPLNLFNPFNSFMGGFYQYPSVFNFNMPSIDFSGFAGVSPSFNFDVTQNNTFVGNPSVWDFSATNTNVFTQNYSIPFYGLDTFSYSASPAAKSKSSKSAIRPYNSKAAALGTRMVENAMHYVGKVNNDAEGNRLFSGGVNRAWCADFVTEISKQSYGSKLPSGFGSATRGGHRYSSSEVYGLQYWGEDNGCYLQLPLNNGSDAKKEFIAQNIKPGDIMIEKRNDKSHTGIVTKVYPDGSFDTVEGNCSNSVKTQHYTADSSTLSGFVALSKFA